MADAAHLGRLAGDTLTAAQLNQDIRDNINIIAAVGITGWTSYTATWTSDGTQPALGSGGTAVGYYCQLGKLVVANAAVLLGTTPTVGTGSYRWAIPVTADAQAVNLSADRLAGIMWFRDASGNIYKCMAMLATTTTLFAYIEDTAATQLGATAPVVPASNDKYNYIIAYEAA